MKKIFAMLLLLCSLCSVSFANEQEVVASFQSFVSNLVAPIESTYGNNYYRIIEAPPYESSTSLKYMKVQQTDFMYSCDIKKTDSVMYPYLGVLEISNKHNYTDFFTTEIEARNAIVYTTKSHHQHRFTYRYCNGKWEENRAYMYLDGHWLDSSFKSINSYKCTQN